MVVDKIAGAIMGLSGQNEETAQPGVQKKSDVEKVMDVMREIF